MLITALITGKFCKHFFNSFHDFRTTANYIHNAKNKEKSTENSLFRSIFDAFGAEGGI